MCRSLAIAFCFRDLIDAILLQVEVRQDVSGVSLNSFADGKKEYNMEPLFPRQG